MSADNKRCVRYDLDDTGEVQAYFGQLNDFTRALSGRLFSSHWGPRGPQVTLLDPMHHVPLSSYGLRSFTTGDRVYDLSYVVPVSADSRIIIVEGNDVHVTYKAEIYDYAIEHSVPGEPGVIRADGWVWRSAPDGTGLYKVYIKGTGESRFVMGDEVMVDRYIGDAHLGPSGTTYNMLGEFTYAQHRSPLHHWEALDLRPENLAERDERSEVVGSAFLAMVATIGVEPIHTPALKLALRNVLDSCG